ncbi:MAG: hypothetical protein MHMPM18_000012 [Marteilia pararefringens]
MVTSDYIKGSGSYSNVFGKFEGALKAHRKRLGRKYFGTTLLLTNLGAFLIWSADYTHANVTPDSVYPTSDSKAMLSACIYGQMFYTDDPGNHYKSKDSTVPLYIYYFIPFLITAVSFFYYYIESKCLKRHDFENSITIMVEEHLGTVKKDLVEANTVEDLDKILVNQTRVVDLVDKLLSTHGYIYRNAIFHLFGILITASICIFLLFLKTKGPDSTPFFVPRRGFCHFNAQNFDLSAVNNVTTNKYFPQYKVIGNDENGQNILLNVVINGTPLLNLILYFYTAANGLLFLYFCIELYLFIHKSMSNRIEFGSKTKLTKSLALVTDLQESLRASNEKLLHAKKLVSDIMNGEEYAAKVVPLKSKSDQIDLLNEMNILRKLNHKNVLKLKEVYVYNKKAWIVTELCLCELSIFTKAFQLDQDLYCFIMGCISSGLSYLHGKKIAHRDIKLDNVLLRKSDNMFVIVDMGVSKLVEANSRMSSVRTKNKFEDHLAMKTLVGTPIFIAPEVVKTHKGKHQSYNEIADIWSLGMIGYFMVTNDMPYKGDSPKAILKEVQHKSSKISISTNKMSVTALDKDLRDFNNLMLNKKAKNRPNAAQCGEFFAKYTPKGIDVKMNSLVEKLSASICKKRNVSRSDLPMPLQAFNSMSKKAARENAARMQCPKNNPPVKNSSINGLRVSKVLENPPSGPGENIESNLRGSLSGNLNRKSVANRNETQGLNQGNCSKVSNAPRRYSVAKALSPNLDHKEELSGNSLEIDRFYRNTDHGQLNKSESPTSYINIGVVQKMVHNDGLDSTNVIVESEITKRPSPVIQDQNVSGLDANVCRLQGAAKYVGVAGKCETIIVFANNIVAVLDQNKKKELFRMQEEPIKAVLPLKFNAIEFGFICLRETGELYHIHTERTNNLNGNSFRVGDKTRIIDGIDPSYPVIGLKYCNGADILIAYSQKSVYAIEMTDRMYPNVKLLFDTKEDLSISEKISDCNCTLRRTSSGDIYEILVICIDHKNVMKVYQCSLATAMWKKSIRECIVPDNKLKNPINEALYIQQQKIFPDLPHDDYVFVSIGNEILTYSVEALNHKTISYGDEMESVKLDLNLHFHILRNLDHDRIIINGNLSKDDKRLFGKFNHIFKDYRLISTGSQGKIMRMIFIDDSNESGKITHLLSIERNN